MPIPLRRYGEKYMKYIQRKEREAFRDIQLYIRNELQSQLMGKVMMLMDKIYPYDSFDLAAWKRNQKSFLNQQIQKPFNDFSSWFGKLAHEYQKLGFYQSRKFLVDELKDINYPAKYFKDIYC